MTNRGSRPSAIERLFPGGADWIGGRFRNASTRYAPAGSLKRGFMFVFAGTGAGQAIVVAASPVLSRLYGPEEFGVFAVFSAVATLITAVASLRYEMAIPIPETDAEGGSVLVVAGATVTLVTALTVGGLLVCYASNAVPGYLDSARRYLWLLPIAVFAPGIQAVLLNWAVRKRAYGMIARTRLWQGLALVIVQVGFGAMHAGPLGLIAGFIAGQTAGATSLVRSAWRDDKATFSRISLRGALKTAAAYWRFPTFNAPSTLMNQLTGSLPPLVLSSVFGAATAGSFAFSQRVFAAPFTLVGKSVSQVYFAEIAKDLYTDPARIWTRFRQVTKAMSLCGLGMAALALTAPHWFPLAFGRKWDVAAVYSQYYAPVFATNMAFATTINFNLFGLNSWQFAWDGFQMVLLLISMWWIARHPADPQAAVMLIAAIACVGYLAVFFLNRKAHRTGSRTAVCDVSQASV